MNALPASLLEWLDSTLGETRSKAPTLPLVTLSYAQSLDGSITAQQGEALILSGKASLRMTHALRARHDVILVGIGTVLADNPQLTVRELEGRNPQPVVLDSVLKIPLDARLFDQPPMPWIFTGKSDEERVAALMTQGAEIIQVSQDDAGFLQLDEVLRQLGVRGIRSLMVEGGGRVIQGFLAQGLIDQIVLTIAPAFVGGYKAVDNLIENNYPRIQDPQVALMENDIIVWGALS